ncbi:hypothetical protein CR513_55276, partial [Mucuna pruriens]
SDVAAEVDTTLGRSLLGYWTAESPGREGVRWTEKLGLAEMESGPVRCIKCDSSSFIFQVATRHAYSNNAVLWRYPTQDTVAPPVANKDATPEITNIAETGGVTRSGRVFALDRLRNKKIMLARKDKAIETLKKVVMEEEAQEFLKMIRHSKYEMLDQLHKTQTQISLLSLLINPKGHREFLLKVLNDAHLPQDITLEIFGGIINNITTSCLVSFTKVEHLAEGKNHNQPLHITVKCGSYMIAKVLVDNKSSLNVMSKAILDKLYLSNAMLKSSLVMVRTFDGSKREVMGEITHRANHVMDIRPTYSCFLGQPWIHAVGAIPSSLHQKVKFIADGQLISVMGEKELIVNTPLLDEYVEGDEEALETSFQA